MSDFSDLHIAIIRYINRGGCPDRESIIRDVSWGGQGWTRKDVQQALAYLRKEGHVYRVPDGWYQTDLKV